MFLEAAFLPSRETISVRLSPVPVSTRSPTFSFSIATGQTSVAIGVPATKQAPPVEHSGEPSSLTTGWSVWVFF
jgi:hypothetical protein